MVLYLNVLNKCTNVFIFLESVSLSLFTVFEQENTKLHLNLIDLEFSGDVKQNEANILSHFDKVIKSSMPIATRVVFSQRKVEFLEDFGSDISK